MTAEEPINPNAKTIRLMICIVTIFFHSANNAHYTKFQFGFAKGDRLETVRTLIGSSSAQLSSIAAECAFKSPTALNNLFKRKYGLSMRDYRKGLHVKNRA